MYGMYVKEVLLVWGENDRVFDIHQGLKLKKYPHCTPFSEFMNFSFSLRCMILSKTRAY
jgi:hypothetical protein